MYFRTSSNCSRVLLIELSLSVNVMVDIVDTADDNVDVGLDSKVALGNNERRLLISLPEVSFLGVQIELSLLFSVTLWFFSFGI